MARTRSPERAGWPPHLKGKPNGDYSYMSPLTKKTVSLGKDFDKAVRYAKRANRELEAVRAGELHMRALSANGVRDKRGLFEHQHISSQAMLYDCVVGVYFLLMDDEIVYIGKSNDVLRRLSQHRLDAEKQFNRVFLIECQLVEMGRLEAMYINKFKPKYNASIPPDNPNAVVWEGTFTTMLSTTHVR